MATVSCAARPSAGWPDFAGQRRCGHGLHGGRCGPSGRCSRSAGQHSTLYSARGALRDRLADSLSMGHHRATEDLLTAGWDALRAGDWQHARG
jgi:hypothetical protein